MKNLPLEDGFLPAEKFAYLATQVDPYILASLVREPQQLRGLTPREPSASYGTGVLACASHAAVLITAGKKQVLVDPGNLVSLPDCDPSVIAVTHAHADHAGQLLDAAARYPRAFVLASQGTYNLLQLLPADTPRQIMDLFQARGFLLPENGSAIRIEDIVFRAFPAGHLIGAVMFDIQIDRSRILVTGDFALRETAGLPGAAWPVADYDVLIMESSHAWDSNYPTADPATNRQDLIGKCQHLEQQGISRIVIVASALGEASEVYYTLCKAQMSGALPHYSIRLHGKAFSVSQFYAEANQFAFDPWRIPLKGASKDYFPSKSIVIASEIEEGLSHGNKIEASPRNHQGDCAVLRARAGAPDKGDSLHYTISLHASLYELYATAMAIRCRQVALYHGAHGNGILKSPLAQLLEASGRTVTYLETMPKLIGGSL